jgi:hypothetical protein
MLAKAVNHSWSNPSTRSTMTCAMKLPGTRDHQGKSQKQDSVNGSLIFGKCTTNVLLLGGKTEAGVGVGRRLEKGRFEVGSFGLLILGCALGLIWIQHLSGFMGFRGSGYGYSDDQEEGLGVRSCFHFIFPMSTFSLLSYSWVDSFDIALWFLEFMIWRRT